MTNGCSKRCDGRPRLGLAALWLASCTVWLAWAGADTVAQAQHVEPAPSAALFATSGAEHGDAGLDSVVKAELERLETVRLSVQPGLDLEAVQLALDCVAQSAACLRSVAASSGVDVLIAPALVRKEARLELTLLYFDSRGGSPPRIVNHVQSGTTLSSATLDAIPAMLRELLGLPAAPAAGKSPAPAVGEPAPAPDTETKLAPELGAETPAQGAERRLPIAPIVLAGAGVLALAGGITTGLIANGTQDDYDALTHDQPLSRSAVDRARDKESAGKTQAVLTNVMVGAGAAAIVAAGVWLALELRAPAESVQSSARRSRPRSSTAWLPLVGPTQLGVGLVHRGASL